jgi:hypothetical protein
MYPSLRNNPNYETIKRSHARMSSDVYFPYAPQKIARRAMDK